MESFLSASKAALLNLPVYERIRIVLGNETCDLDSAVSALVQAFSEYLDGIKKKKVNLAVIPVMNIPEKDYRLKTEVAYFLKRHDVFPNLLTFRDEIDLKALRETRGSKLEVVLVDHHSLSDEDIYLVDLVVKIIDHRPRDERWAWPGREISLESVGSCATLVARDFLKKHPEVIDSQISSLLQGPILIDTGNFSKHADRATPVDIEVFQALEKISPSDLGRDKAFEEIVKAKLDISELTTDDLLRKDLKVTVGVPIVGLPMLVKRFLDLQSNLKSLGDFAKGKDSRIVILMGLEHDSEKVSRDIAVFSLSDNGLREKMIEALTVFAEPSLELALIREIHEEDGNLSLILYAQNNLRATRKQILPIVRNVVSSSECGC